jgi:hypothetical protein
VLTGPIPSEITMLHDLEELRLMDNMLNDEIPKGIGELPKPFQMYLQAFIK